MNTKEMTASLVRDFLESHPPFSVDTLGDGSVLAVQRHSTETSCNHHQLHGATGQEYQKPLLFSLAPSLPYRNPPSREVIVVQSNLCVHTKYENMDKIYLYPIWEYLQKKRVTSSI